MDIFENRRFTFFDVETPNHRNDAMSSIGIVTVSSDGEVEEKYYLINPEQPFDEFNIQLTKITPKMVENEPTFDEVWKEIESDFTDSVLVAHNATFDLTVLNKCLARYNLARKPLSYMCTVQLARKYLRLPSHRLNALCEYFGIELDHHHAVSDAQACMEIFYRIHERHPLSSNEIRKYFPKY